MKEAFLDLHPILETYEFNLENFKNSDDKRLMDKSDFEYIKSEIHAAIDQSLQGVQEIANMEFRLIHIIRQCLINPNLLFSA